MKPGCFFRSRRSRRGITERAQHDRLFLLCRDYGIYCSCIFPVQDRLLLFPHREQVLGKVRITDQGILLVFRDHGVCQAFSGRINRRLHLNADEDTLLTGAMLHDFYLYDWHNKDGGSHNLHGYIHADRALENARRYFHVDEKTAHVIRCHMWPLNITRLPRSREAWIVCIADKCVSVKETLFER